MTFVYSYQSIPQLIVIGNMVSVFSTASWLLTCMSNCSSKSSSTNSTGLTICFRPQFQIALLVHKALNGQTPAYLTYLFFSLLLPSTSLPTVISHKLDIVQAPKPL
ncbi:eukaryotic translation initiation factor 3 subunit H [Platysternon megacephalum]|uniref:Eukaryotic translation initiation factor 3 subunit H n=1 Tax=Platysternon megacephalum TaxID=55544 RepID=A0A4D9EQ86_9SAUR|nr:eukaryotic translation initiation factor 3 subunit H [Platysternon megacephalum]